MAIRIAFVVLAVAVISVGTMNAHHGYNDFLRDQTVSVEGTLDQILLANPHVMLTIKTANGDTFAVEWKTAREIVDFYKQAGAAGVPNGSLKVGDRIVVSGSPKRNPADHKISLLKEVRRPADGWRWPAQ